jgi:hypothetical protein
MGPKASEVLEREEATLRSPLPTRGAPRKTSTLTPIIRAMSPHPSANSPLSSTSTVSPRDNTLVSAPPQPPWPFAA